MAANCSAQTRKNKNNKKIIKGHVSPSRVIRPLATNPRNDNPCSRIRVFGDILQGGTFGRRIKLHCCSTDQPCLPGGQQPHAHAHVGLESGPPADLSIEIEGEKATREGSKQQPARNVLGTGGVRFTALQRAGFPCSFRSSSPPRSRVDVGPRQTFKLFAYQVYFNAKNTYLYGCREEYPSISHPLFDFLSSLWNCHKLARSHGRIKRGPNLR